MPTYEYQCGACRHEWETEQSIKDDPLKDCPKCSAAAAKRQISKGTGFILKGGSGPSASSSGGSSAGPTDPSQVSASAFQERFEKVSGVKLDKG